MLYSFSATIANASSMVLTVAFSCPHASKSFFHVVKSTMPVSGSISDAWKACNAFFVSVPMNQYSASSSPQLNPSEESMACILWTAKPPSSSRKMGHSTETPDEPFTSIKSSSARGPASMSSPYGSSSSFEETASNFFCASSNAFRAIPSRHEATSSSKIAPGAGPHSNFSLPSNANHVSVSIMPLTSNPIPFEPWKYSTASSVFFPEIHLLRVVFAAPKPILH
mmetsp:Transcript_7296/g.22089  ORF Transcript_7296/g.22089 Transcript_7296/m.22089 type:complete len:224 (-) Transcript_7296:453-1124(-)